MRGILAAKPFDKVYTDYIIKSQHVNTPSETNPIESLEALGKVTLLGKGEGGISSEQSVPISARNIDPSHLGILDPSRTPESGHVGIDLRFTQSAGRDDAGNLYARVKDRDGKELYLDVAKMMSSVVGFPNQEGKKEVEAQVRGKIARVDADKVQYWLNDGTDMYTVTTNMVPFLNTNSPGRLTMAGKAIPQALSLVHREAPLIQTAYRDGKTFVRAFGRQISPTAHGNGVVQRVTSEYIQVRYDNGETEKFTLTKNLPFNQKGFFDTEKALVKEGDKVLLWWASGNRDERVFDDPFRVNLFRSPNRHVSFGQGGPHVCLGMWLARLEVRVLFEELAKRIKSIEPAGDHKFLRSNFIGGIKELPGKVTLK